MARSIFRIFCVLGCGVLAATWSVLFAFSPRCAYSQPAQLSSKSQTVALHFIDVGEGDATLIVSPSGETALVDTGNPITGMAVYRYLQKQKLRAIDNLILTHPHIDHIGGAFSLLQLLPVHHVFDNGEPLADPTDRILAWYDELVRTDRKALPLRQGGVVKLGAVKLEVVWPPLDLPSQDVNTNSLVILVTFGNFACLLMGDANADTERVLFSQNPDGKLNGKFKRVQVLRAGHHGAADTASQPLLEAVRPALTVVSVNKFNRNGYPSPDTLTRYRSRESRVVRTDESGNIVVTAKTNGTFTVVLEKQ